MKGQQNEGQNEEDRRTAKAVSLSVKAPMNGEALGQKAVSEHAEQHRKQNDDRRCDQLPFISLDHDFLLLSGLRSTA